MTIDPVETAERLASGGRGGYCFHLNGAFSELLVALGYRVTRHVGGVQRTEEHAPGISGAHMAVTVHELPDVSCATGVWLVDVGLGSALHEPLPLEEGRYGQGPFWYGLRPSGVEPRGWRFDHAPGIGFVGMDFRELPARVDEFAAMHESLSTAPDSPFVRVATVQRRHAGGADVLRGTILTRFRAGEPSVTVLESRSEWFGALEDVFGLALDDLGEPERDALWRRLLGAHAEYVTSRDLRLTSESSALD